MNEINLDPGEIGGLDEVAALRKKYERNDRSDVEVFTEDQRYFLGEWAHNVPLMAGNYLMFDAQGEPFIPLSVNDVTYGVVPLGDTTDTDVKGCRDILFKRVSEGNLLLRDVYPDGYPSNEKWTEHLQQGTRHFMKEQIEGNVPTELDVWRNRIDEMQTADYQGFLKALAKLDGIELTDSAAEEVMNNDGPILEDSFYGAQGAPQLNPEAGSTDPALPGTSAFDDLNAMMEIDSVTLFEALTNNEGYSLNPDWYEADSGLLVNEKIQELGNESEMEQYGPQEHNIENVHTAIDVFQEAIHELHKENSSLSAFTQVDPSLEAYDPNSATEPEAQLVIVLDTGKRAVFSTNSVIYEPAGLTRDTVREGLASALNSYNLPAKNSKLVTSQMLGGQIQPLVLADHELSVSPEEAKLFSVLGRNELSLTGTNRSQAERNEFARWADQVVLTSRTDVDPWNNPVTDYYINKQLVFTIDEKAQNTESAARQELFGRLLSNNEVTQELYKQTSHGVRGSNLSLEEMNIYDQDRQTAFIGYSVLGKSGVMTQKDVPAGYSAYSVIGSDTDGFHWRSLQPMTANNQVDGVVLVKGAMKNDGIRVFDGEPTGNTKSLDELGSEGPSAVDRRRAARRRGLER